MATSNPSLRTGAAERPARHPAELYDLIVGPVLILIGVLGFIASSTFSGTNGSDFIIFSVNGWHNLVHIASGLLLCLGIGHWARARTVTLIFGITYGLVTIIGWIDGHDVLGLFPTDTEDNVLHTVLTIGALATALAPAPAGASARRLSRTSPGEPAADDPRFTREGEAATAAEREREHRI